MAQALLGNEVPRVFTPPLRELTPETSLGYAMIDFAEAIGVPLLTWQKWLAIHMLELKPDGNFRFRTVLLLVGRQNGKSTFSQILALFFMYIQEVPLILSTAQNLDIAEAVWAGGLEMIEDNEELEALHENTVNQRGSKAIILNTGSVWKVGAATRRTARGLSTDLVMLDELREHQNWLAWSAISKTTMARPNGLIFALSNAGDLTSVVLRHLRMQAHKAIGDPDGLWVDQATGEAITEDLIDLDEDSLKAANDSLGIFEWSAAPGRSKYDREGWCEANPSLNQPGSGYTTEAILSALSDPEWEFRTEVLCQWFNGAVEGPFPAGTWEATTDDDSKLDPNSKVVYGLDMSWDRTQTRIVIAGYRPDGRIHFELVASRPGTDWVIPWLSDEKRKYKPSAVTWQGAGAPISSLTEELEKSKLPTAPWQGTELGRGSGQFYDTITRMVDDEQTGQQKHDPIAFHRRQPALDVAASTAIPKSSGDSWFWDRSRSPADVSPLVAATAAVWGLLNREVVVQKSAYDTDDEIELML